MGDMNQLPQDPVVDEPVDTPVDPTVDTLLDDPVQDPNAVAPDPDLDQADALPDEMVILREQLAVERAAREEQAREIETSEKRYRDLGGRLGGQIEALRTQITSGQAPNAYDDPFARPATAQEPPVLPSQEAPYSDARDDMADRMAAMERGQILQEETARLQTTYPVVAKPEVSAVIVKHFQEQRARLEGIRNPALYRAELKSALYDALGKVRAEVKPSATDGRLDAKRRLATPAQTAPRHHTRETQQADPSKMSPKELFLAQMRQPGAHERGFTREEYEARFGGGK